MQQEFSNQINNSENLIVTGFISDKKEIMRYYDACDIFLLTSYEDPFPSVVMEAFNAKKPVIAFENAGGFCDIVINDFSGYLVEYGSSDALVEKIKFLVNNNALKEELGNNAKTICESLKFDEYVKILKSYVLTEK
nr:glycosyltransferase [uncultured Methanobrevibacter sp.]